MEIWFSILGAGLGLIAAAISTLLSYRSTKSRSERQTPTLEDKITTLTKNLQISSSVISEIETEIHKRSEIAEKLKDDVKYYEELKELSESQVEAIAQTIRGEVVSESRKSLWRNAIITFVIALVFFFLGFWLRGV